MEAAARAETFELATRHLDTSLVDVLRILGFDKDYVTARSSYVYDGAGRAYLDFHTGEGFASLGHNNPDVAEVLHAVLGAGLVGGVQIHYSPLAGMLAEELTQRLPAGLEAVFFANSGAEAVDTAMKFARAATRRPRLISCVSSFHGVTLGPLSLQGAQELCRRYGTLFVVDKIQTGLGRTGRWFALEQWGIEPDIVLVGKALSGGYVPIAAMVTTREIHDKAVGTLERSYVHQSTFGRNRLSMATGLAVLRIIERDGLIERGANREPAARRPGATSAALRDHQGGPRHGPDAGLRQALAGIASRALQLALDANGQQGPVSTAHRDPVAPRSQRDHDGGRKERRDQAASFAHRTSS
jgi:ornithine--oxo-acid transaminase